MIGSAFRRYLAWLCLVGVLAGITLTWLISHGFVGSVARSAAPAVEGPPRPILSAPAHGLPTRLEIPKIKVKAAIIQLGLTPAGMMEVPAGVHDTGWYKYGPRPGDSGNAVITGHFGTVKGKRSVFTDLAQLQKGDRLIVTDDKGVATSFLVRETRTYDEGERPNEVFESSDSAHLNLITCAGTWDKVKQRYSKRLVVFTDKSN